MNKFLLTSKVMDSFQVDTNIVAYIHPFVDHVMLVVGDVMNVMSFAVVYDHPIVKVFVPMVLALADLNLRIFKKNKKHLIIKIKHI